MTSNENLFIFLLTWKFKFLPSRSRSFFFWNNKNKFSLQFSKNKKNKVINCSWCINLKKFPVRSLVKTEFFYLWNIWMVMHIMTIKKGMRSASNISHICVCKLMMMISNDPWVFLYTLWSEDEHFLFLGFCISLKEIKMSKIWQTEVNYEGLDEFKNF